MAKPRAARIHRSRSRQNADSCGLPVPARQRSRNSPTFSSVYLPCCADTPAAGAPKRWPSPLQRPRYETFFQNWQRLQPAQAPEPKSALPGFCQDSEDVTNSLQSKPRQAWRLRLAQRTRKPTARPREKAQNLAGQHQTVRTFRGRDLTDCCL